MISLQFHLMMPIRLPCISQPKLLVFFKLSQMG